MANISLKATGAIEVETVLPTGHPDIKPVVFAQLKASQAKFSPGIGLDTLVYQARTLAGSAFEDLDLAAGTLLDVGNAAAPLATVKLFGCFLLTGTGLVVGGAATNPHPLWFGAASHTLAVDDTSPPFLVGSAAGKPVTGTSKAVRVANPTADPVTYLLVVAGLKP